LRPCFRGLVGRVRHERLAFSRGLVTGYRPPGGVEIATDPNGGDGVVQVSPPVAASTNQIGDVGTAWCDYVPNSGRCQSYWSIADSALVLPKMYSVRRTLAGKNIGGKLPHTPSTKAWIASQF
ncbi:hypothetical protein ACFXON_24460, partial [Bacillus subtilis]